MAIKFSQVTWYSKLLTLIFFLGVFPFIAFYVGRQFEKVVTVHFDAETAAYLAQ